jgi:hypothetical protein
MPAVKSLVVNWGVTAQMESLTGENPSSSMTEICHL